MTKKKDPSFIVFGEKLDTKEKLEQAAGEIEAILKRKSPWRSFKKALDKYIKSKNLESSDKTALHAYVLKKYFPLQYAESLKKEPALRNQFKRHIINAQSDAIRRGKSLSPEKFLEGVKAIREWDEDPAKRYEEELTRDRRMTPEELQGHRQYAKPFLGRIYAVVDRKLCARDDCLTPLSPGSRKDRLYCGDRCKSIMKSRKARDRG